MYLECIGAGSPTVVFVSGFRGAHDDWTHVVDPANPTGDPIPARSAVFREVSRFTRVCAYDRPGTTQFGGAPTTSAPVSQPTTAGDGAADLQALLTAAREPGPFVVVAHSWGGLIARLFASRYPSAVVGLVLLDPGSEFLETSLMPAQWANFVRAAKALGEPTDLEAADYEPSVAALRVAAPVRVFPVAMLSSDKPFDFGVGSAATWPAWQAAQDRVATLFNAKHVTRTNSGHFIRGEQLQLAIKAIRQVVEAARKKCAAIPCEGMPPKSRPIVLPDYAPSK
jgi:pimeloyl-ACP methyl ester carboxylesterase